MSSWWDKYLAPGDLRAQNIQQPPSPPPPSPTSAFPTRISAAHRARRQNALLFGGLAFTALSLFVTRRASRKKYLSTYPSLVKNTKTGSVNVPHFTQSNTSPKAEGGLDAVEALFIATLSVTSIFMTGTGAFMKYFDVADIEDLRDFVRKGTGQDVFGGERDEEAEKEIEGWMAEVLARKDGTGGLKESIVEKLAEMKEKDKQAAEEVKKMESVKK